ncbi:MAG TPA: hypothetical protein PLZ56_06860, partial [Anaerolineae bacterium]|nr:hypothetical protein [Anaerolineae bacterium]
MSRSLLQHPSLRSGLIAGLVTVFLGLVGFLSAFQDDALLVGHLLGANRSLTLGTAVVLAALIWAGARAAPAGRPGWPAPRGPLYGALAGLVAALVLAAFARLGRSVDLRAIFPKASPELYDMVAFSGGAFAGEAGWELLRLLILGAAMGLLGALWQGLAPRWRRLATPAILLVLGLGVFAEQFLLVLAHNGIAEHFRGWLFLKGGGLAAPGAILVAFLAVAAGLAAERGWTPRQALARQAPARRRAILSLGWTLALALTLVLPWLLGSYHSDVLDTVGL